MAVVDDWWGRDVLPGLPRAFLDHFHKTSLIAERGGRIVGFLIGFHSPGEREVAYIHYAAVAPTERGEGLARRLYEEFAATAERAGLARVRAITSPVNEASIAFHRALGLEVEGPIGGYNGPGRDRVSFARELEPRRAFRTSPSALDIVAERLRAARGKLEWDTELPCVRRFHSGPVGQQDRAPRRSGRAHLRLEQRRAHKERIMTATSVML
ncbi:MAG: GNAT family N-acetyltransferase [Solirubrobacteraceae bacterium]